VNLIAEIGETIGRYTVLAEQNLTPRLRRENRSCTHSRPNGSGTNSNPFHHRRKDCPVPPSDQ
jgi:hypothetical protein